jgi:hypothetical protein
LQKSIVKQDAASWARIEQVTVKCSPQKAKLDDNLAFTVGFRLDGVVRRNFHQKFWEAAYDQHDGGLRMAFKVDLRKSGIRLPGKPLKEEKFVRRAVFFWTRNPEIPHRVWMTVATEFETILYPKTEEEARDMMFNVTRSFELPASSLGKGDHNLGASVSAKWGKHVFTERGEASGKSPSLRIQID